MKRKIGMGYNNNRDFEVRKEKPKTIPVKSKQKSKNDKMKKRTPGVRECKICGTRKGMIRKYKLGICRRCFKDRAQDLGWEKY